MGKIFAIGDIHGCGAHLDKMMERLDIHPENDTLVFIGDYIDRGPDSRGVVDALLQIRLKIKNTVFLTGNHEQMFLKYYREGKDEELFMHNGGLNTLISYGLAGAGKKYQTIPDTHMEFFTTLRTWFMTEDYIFVHAGLRPGIPLEQQSTDDLIWIRSEFINSSYDFGKIVIFGHTPLSATLPLIQNNKIGIDTGAVYGGKLTCIELPEMKIQQV